MYISADPSACGNYISSCRLSKAIRYRIRVVCRKRDFIDFEFKFEAKRSESKAKAKSRSEALTKSPRVLLGRSRGSRGSRGSPGYPAPRMTLPPGRSVLLYALANIAYFAVWIHPIIHQNLTFCCTSLLKHSFSLCYKYVIFENHSI